MCDCEREKLCRGGPQPKKKRYSNILRYSRAAAAAAAGSSVASVASAAAAGAGTTSCMCHWNWCTWTLLHMNGARGEGRGRGIASKGTETKVAAAIPCETVTTACVCVCVHMCICVCVCVCALFRYLKTWKTNGESTWGNPQLPLVVLKWQRALKLFGHRPQQQCVVPSNLCAWSLYLCLCLCLRHWEMRPCSSISWSMRYLNWISNRFRQHHENLHLTDNCLLIHQLWRIYFYSI